MSLGQHQESSSGAHGWAGELARDDECAAADGCTSEGARMGTPRVAITRAGGELARGWIAAPVTRRRMLPEGCRQLAAIFAGIAAADSLTRDLGGAETFSVPKINVSENAGADLRGIGGVGESGEQNAGESRKPFAASQTGEIAQKGGLASGSPTWLAVTSGFTFTVLAQAGIPIPAQLRVACVGAATAAQSPVNPALVGPPPASAKALVGAFPAVQDLSAHMDAPLVIFPASALASSDLENGLLKRGYRVQRVNVYATEPDVEGVERLVASHPAVIVVTSSSAAQALAVHYLPVAIAQGLSPEIPPLVAIGAPTARAIRAAGLQVASQAASTHKKDVAYAVDQALAMGRS
ncbi:MAG: uroporphyrinogen-III synthase [Arcanobacterium sp.]|nr:uroporphyrinogen-III synthase [Arcanobacterium sp.]